MVNHEYRWRKDEYANISDLKKWACSLVFRGTPNDTFRITYETKPSPLHHPSSDVLTVLLSSLPLYSLYLIIKAYALDERLSLGYPLILLQIQYLALKSLQASLIFELVYWH